MAAMNGEATRFGAHRLETASGGADGADPPHLLPLVELHAAEIAGRLLLAIVAAPDLTALTVEPAVILRRGVRVEAMVWAKFGETGFDALMSAATARAAAVRIAADPWALAACQDPAALGLRFTQAADDADALVAGTDPKELYVGTID